MHPADRPLRLAVLVALALAALAPAAAAQTSPAIDLLRRSSSSRARVRAAEALGRLRPDGARAALEAALDDRSAPVRVASAQALEALGDPDAMPALDRHARDRDGRTRDAVVHARQALLRRVPPLAPTVGSAYSATAPATTTYVAAPAAPAPPALPRAINWQRVRVLITLGTLGCTASRDPLHVAQLREALRAAVGEDERYAIHPGVLPPSARARLRSGDLRAYSVEGTLTTLREGRDGPRVSVRAEVSLLLVVEPAHSIAGTLAGAATAQETPPMIPNAPDPLPRLRLRAIEGAAHGALRSLESQLLAQR